MDWSQSRMRPHGLILTAVTGLKLLTCSVRRRLWSNHADCRWWPPWWRQRQWWWSLTEANMPLMKCHFQSYNEWLKWEISKTMKAANFLRYRLSSLGRTIAWTTQIICLDLTARISLQHWGRKPVSLQRTLSSWRDSVSQQISLDAGSSVHWRIHSNCFSLILLVKLSCFAVCAIQNSLLFVGEGINRPLYSVYVRARRICTKRDRSTRCVIIWVTNF